MYDPDTEYLVGISALRIAKDLRTYQALLMGLHVPQHRCKPTILDQLGVQPDDGAVRMTLELALLIETYR